MGQNKKVWLESDANILKSEKDDLDAERDELRSEINFGKSNEKDNSIQGKKFVSLTVMKSFPC